MSLQFAKIELLAVFMGYLALPDASSTLPNVMTHIHGKGLSVKDGRVDASIDNAERLANSVKNLEKLAKKLGVDETLNNPTRDPRGVIAEHIIGSIKHDLLKVPGMDGQKFKAFAMPAAKEPEKDSTAYILGEIGANRGTKITLHQAAASKENRTPDKSGADQKVGKNAVEPEQDKPRIKH